ncbi:MAG: hypothetical protein ACODAJ_12615 [Planctomycetota bacterium]
MAVVSASQRRCAPRLAGLVTHPVVQVALGLVAVGLAIAVGVAWGRRSAASKDKPQAPLPEAHPVWDSWRAAWVGDVGAYLGCFTGPARQRLDAELEAQGREAFAQRLRERGAEAEAIELAPPEPQADGSIVLSVTVRHGDDADLIDYRVVRAGTGWKIAEVVSRDRGRDVEP